jgi:acetyl/propionyl-CoA carboxylase alpha subunit
VTEAITGLDLVEWQLRVASGEPLPLRQEQIKLTGHAIEARICAETPDNNFLPATGHLQVYNKPAHTAFERGTVRFDDGVRTGDTISPFYDSMVAKLIVHGDTREQALALLDQALAQTQVVGLSTNVQFLRYVVHSPSFAEARLDTALIPREAKVLFEQRLHHFAPLLGVRWQKLSLSSASTRWGSARNDGHIRLNWRLIHLPISQIDYVVVHELSHLRVMDHSPRFLDTVGTVVPDYPQLRAQLRQQPLAQW